MGVDSATELLGTLKGGLASGQINRHLGRLLVVWSPVLTALDLAFLSNRSGFGLTPIGTLN